FRRPSDGSVEGRRRRGLLAAAVAVASVAAALPVALGESGAAAATAPCSVTYQVNQWSGGFTANVSVTNGGAALTAWTISWSFDGTQQITSAWNAQVTQSGKAATATNESYNGAVAAGGSQFGFQGTWSGTNDTPTNFALNGASCGGGSTSASPSASASASATPSPSASASAS